MKSFKNYVLTEAATDAAKDMEYALVDAAGGNSGKKKYPGLEPKAKKNRFKSSLELAKMILKNARGLNLAGKSMMAKNKYPLSKEWLGKNKTPKTDIVLGGSKVSLKTGSAQLMSGGPAESLSTFNAAVRATGIEVGGLASEIEEGIKNLLPSTEGEFMGGVEIQKKGGTVYKNTRQKKGKIGDVEAGTFDKDKILKAADDFNLKLKKQFADLFAGNQDFKKEFVFEAMTGKVKFGGNEGTAESFLVASYNGSADYHEVKNSSDPYVASILSKVKPDVKFKSTAVKRSIDGKNTKTGHYRFWSVIGLGYNAAVKANKEVNEAYDLYNSGELLTEGFLDVIKNIWNKFKTWLVNLLKKVKEWISESVENMMNFLGLKPDIEFNNEITW